MNLKRKITILYWKLCYNSKTTFELCSILHYIDDIRESVWWGNDKTPEDTRIIADLINKIIDKREARDKIYRRLK